MDKLQQEYMEFQMIKADLGLYVAGAEAIESTETLGLVKAMYKDSRLDDMILPLRSKSRWKYSAKLLLQKLGKVFIKVSLKRQQNFNDEVVLLAHLVMNLEERVQELEKKLQEAEVSL